MPTGLRCHKRLATLWVAAWVLIGCQSVSGHQSYSNPFAERDYVSSLPCPIPSEESQHGVVKEEAKPYRSHEFLPNYVGSYQCKSWSFVKTTQLVNRINKIVVELNRRSGITYEVEVTLLNLRDDMDKVGDMVAGWWNYGRDAELAADNFNSRAAEELPGLEKKLQDAMRGDVTSTP